MLAAKRYLSNSYIEVRSFDVLRRYFQLHPPPALPLRVERLAEDLFDLVISWEAVAEIDGAFTLGALRVRRRQLVLNERAIEHFKKFPGSENFTKAHEVAHWVLHVRAAPASIELFSLEAADEILCTSAAAKPQREIQADLFASMLLMPRDLLLRECQGRNLGTWPALYDLAALLEVSISALRIRLENLGVLRVDEQGSIALQERGHQLSRRSTA